MGATITCEKCKKARRYSSSEIENIGTVWHPIWVVVCNNCGAQITWEQGSLNFFDNMQISKTKNGVEIKSKASGKTGAERAQSSDIREYWIQQYVKDNYAKIGFSEIEGPFDIGPDFKGVYKGKEVIVEAERDCQSFIQHKHHENERFKEVSILIVLNPSKPAEKIKNRLPETIIYIDVDDFVEWWRPKARAYANKSRIRGIIDLIADEFQKRFVTDCVDKDRDMSTCPECDLCSYFGSSVFQKAALRFIALYEYPIISEGFGLSTIKPSEIDKFYNAYYV